jgi:DNA polymerase III subunit gamma/tau
MSYLVFARKFRPQNFEAVVGQEPIITTLQNAIKQNRIPQNFLFAGPRGCGKTSTARILAKALNCAKGPTETPCDKCPSCKEITESNSMDVLEIDGASNRGIDEIRNLRETVKFKPVSGRMKIYIIDEVHMLTTEAFNALLKTLEEPPPHVKFIFATTEAHKVPLTILSRCHRFNFKRIPIQEIAGKLEEIAKAEKIKCDKTTLFLIAKTSDGALRDAEGMLDQLASFSEGKIKEEDVLVMLGLASEEVYFSVLTALKEKNAQKIFSIIEELYEGGRDLVQFAKGLLEIFRHLLLLQCAEDTKSFVEMSDESVKELIQRKNDFPREELLLALSFMGNLQGQLRRNLAPPRLLVEVALLKLLHLDGFQTVSQLVEGETSAPQSRPRPASVSLPAAAPASSPRPAPSSAARPAMAVSEPVAAPRPSANNAGSLSLNDVEMAWPRVIDYVKAKRMSTGIFLSEAEPVEVNDSLITIGFPGEFQFHKDMLEKSANKQLVEEAFEVTSGKKVRVQFVVTEADRQEHPVKTAAPAASPSAPASSGEPSGKLTEIITEALNIFDGAKIVRAE